MTANETAVFAKLQQLDFCLEVLFGLVCSGFPHELSDAVKAQMVAHSAHPDLSDTVPPETPDDEQAEAQLQQLAHNFVVEFVERLTGSESAFRCAVGKGADMPADLFARIIKHNLYNLEDTK
jgi:hypothetical protein